MYIRIQIGAPFANKFLSRNNRYVLYILQKTITLNREKRCCRRSIFANSQFVSSLYYVQKKNVLDRSAKTGHDIRYHTYERTTHRFRTNVKTDTECILSNTEEDTNKEKMCVCVYTFARNIPPIQLHGITAFYIITRRVLYPYYVSSGRITQV